MHSRLLMIASAFAMAVPGVAATFLPQELLGLAGIEPVVAAVVAVQIAGALYLGFAILNWTARGVLIGGIYARPVALSNFFHFAIVAITLAKILVDRMSPWLLLATVVYAVFALWFGKVLFTTPAQVSAQK